MGSSDVPTHVANVSIDLQGIIESPVYAGFTAGLDRFAFGLLGQTGFFDRLDVTFGFRNRVCYIEVPNYLRNP